MLSTDLMNGGNRKIRQAANYNAKTIDTPSGFGYNKMDFEYMGNWFLDLDVKIIVKTLLTVILRKGAL